MSTPASGRTGGPNPGILAIASTGLFIGSLVSAAALTGGQLYVSPFAGAAEIARYFAENAFAARVSGTLQFASAVPFGILTATLYTRQQRLGVRVPGPSIGLFGGVAASVLLMISGLLTWVLAHVSVEMADAAGSPSTAAALALLAFATGGVGFVVGAGLLVASVAVPGLILGLIPRWLAWTGLVLAALSELSFLSLLVEPLQFLLPIGRFGGLIWLILAGFALPTTRASARAAREGAKTAAD